MLDDYYDLSLTERWFIVLGLALLIGLFLGIFMHRESQRRQPIYGGPGARLFNYLATAAFSGLIPGIILGIISDLHFTRIMAFGLTMAAINFVCLSAYGFFESQANVVDLKPKRELD